MKLLITGANGQLGRELRALLDGDSRFDPTYTDVEELDITSPDAVNSMVNALAPDYIINCAAYTAVDRAEDDEATALLINARAVEILATAAASMGARMIHVSTDYVFDGNGNRPYREDDAPNPVSLWQIHGHDTDRETLLRNILDRFSLYINKDVKSRYVNMLYRRKGFHPYCDKDGAFMAEFKDVEDDGHLVLSKENGQQCRYAFQEIQFII